MPSYELIPNCTVDDRTTIAKCTVSAFWEETWWRLLWADRTRESLIDSIAARTPRSLLQMRPVRRHQKVVDKDSGDVVGYARWDLPAEHEGKWAEAQTPDVDDAAKEKFKQESADAEYEPREDMDEMDDHAWEWREKYDRDDCLELDYIAVHPDHQRKGIANMLLQSGIKVADELGLDILVFAMGSSVLGLYLKAGFEILEKESQDLAPYGEEGVYETYYLIRKAPKEEKS